MNSNLKQKIAAKSDKALVIMLTYERFDYNPEAINLAEEECKIRGISKESILRFVSKDPLRDRPESSFQRYERLPQEEWSDEDEMWEEAQNPWNPKPYDNVLHPVSELSIEPFFTPDCDQDLRNGICPICHKQNHDQAGYCLVGRHSIKKLEENRLSFIRTTTKTRAQLCYIPICKLCRDQLLDDTYMRSPVRKSLAAVCGMAFLVILVGGWFLLPKSAVVLLLILSGLATFCLYTWSIQYLSPLHALRDRVELSKGHIHPCDVFPVIGVPDWAEKEHNLIVKDLVE